MTEVEYTEQALSHLEALDPPVADQVMNKVDEATEWTYHRLDPLYFLLCFIRSERAESPVGKLLRISRIKIVGCIECVRGEHRRICLFWAVGATCLYG